MTGSWVLNAAIFLPLLFAVAVARFPAGEKGLLRGMTLVGMALTAIVSVIL